MLEWIADAACRNHPSEWWDTYQGGHRTVYNRALTICKTCPVKAECLSYAMRNEGYSSQEAAHCRYGIYGGLLPIDRDRLAYRQRRMLDVSPRKESCVNGHPLEGDNVYRRPDGRRQCRTCIRSYWQRTA